jgi:hypothetical protein
MHTKPGAETQWEELLTAREVNEVHLAHHYAVHFAHGTTGHNQLMLIRKLASMLNACERSAVNVREVWEPPTE